MSSSGGTPVSVRPATRADAGPVAALSGQLGYATTLDKVEHRLERLLAGERDIVYVAIDPAGEVVGWIQASVRELVMVDHHAEVGGLVVAEGQRGRGCGRMLMAAAESWARQGLQGGLRPLQHRAPGRAPVLPEAGLRPLQDAGCVSQGTLTGWAEGQDRRNKPDRHKAAVMGDRHWGRGD